MHDKLFAGSAYFFEVPPDMQQLRAVLLHIQQKRRSNGAAFAERRGMQLRTGVP
jgi:hypothetical protein